MPSRQPRTGRRAEYLRAWYQANRESELARNQANRQAKKDAVDAIKIERGCADCDYREHAVALDFDHVRGVKVAHVGTMVNRGVAMKTILAEIEKCEVVCANCHRVRTTRRKQWGVSPKSA